MSNSNKQLLNELISTLSIKMKDPNSDKLILKENIKTLSKFYENIELADMSKIDIDFISNRMYSSLLRGDSCLGVMLENKRGGSICRSSKNSILIKFEGDTCDFTVNGDVEIIEYDDKIVILDDDFITIFSFDDFYNESNLNRKYYDLLIDGSIIEKPEV